MSSAKRSFYVLSAGIFLTIMVLIAISVAGIISSQVFAILTLSVLGLGSIALAFLLRARLAAIRPAHDLQPQRRSTLKYLRLVTLVIVMIVAFWLTRGEPLWPRVIGFSVGIFLLIGASRSKRIAK
jgi:hypothetical protein